MRQKKDTLWTIKTTEEFIARLKRASDVLDIPASQLTREAVTEKLDKLAKRFPQIDEPQAEERPAAAVAA